MATLTVIVGYCGAGKTVVWGRLATACPEAALMDGGFALPVDEGTFEEKGGKTLLTMHDLYPSKEALDATLASGMEPGMRETLDQLDELAVLLVADVGRS